MVRAFVACTFFESITKTRFSSVSNWNPDMSTRVVLAGRDLGDYPGRVLPLMAYICERGTFNIKNGTAKVKESELEAEFPRIKVCRVPPTGQVF